MFIPVLACGDIAWPALYAETKVNSLPIIALSLILEYLVIRWLFKTSVQKGILYTVAANVASGLVGLFLRPLSGIAWELSFGLLVHSIFGWGTFNPVTWFFVPVIGGALNAAIELYTIKRIWGERFTGRRFCVLWGANYITVGIATIWGSTHLSL